ncbi:methylated-DNA--[protein]-cysteine S-methyltransferase [Kitasatospora sp. YST-16]|uniref:methylated-DNA--[protein]-cysteine S-methyltransferase n=1 Tax=unclassified Kitasatospora TaxID=2633591 RepID=UPI0004C38A03|nr:MULTISPECIES: methylated-DNA--[protein]-cysteine S-methyltransferase [unclassified Kitasatospora]WAL71243.1 methylated-DNA--[protein]-cysteine S-methyltransferase [Kitasatospora sp. YST-16]WNW37279.1 methylated-DNA--[protein]-cysteine S-methyltransferase [Streptomyces sp. Li-HN-5-13]
MTTAPATPATAPTTVFTTMDSPLGTLLLSGPLDADGRFALAAVTAPGQKGALAEPAAHWRPDADALAPAVEQLTAYFAGERTTFDLPLAPVGTAFRQQVWDALDDIPYGATLTYGQLADAAGQSPRAVRAVGGAVGANPLLIVRPCHRVMGANGSLTGFAAGIDAKRWLLAHESGDRLF